MKNIVRKTFVPLSFRVSSRASPRPPTLIRMIETTAKLTVNTNECLKASSVSAYLKLSRPVHLALLTVVNLQNDRYSPSMNGITKPMTNAAVVGMTNIGAYFLSALSIVHLIL